MSPMSAARKPSAQRARNPKLLTPNNLNGTLATTMSTSPLTQLDPHRFMPSQLRLDAKRFQGRPYHSLGSSPVSVVAPPPYLTTYRPQLGQSSYPTPSPLSNISSDYRFQGEKERRSFVPQYAQGSYSISHYRQPHVQHQVRYASEHAQYTTQHSQPYKQLLVGSHDQYIPSPSPDVQQLSKPHPTTRHNYCSENTLVDPVIEEQSKQQQNRALIAPLDIDQWIRRREPLFPETKAKMQYEAERAASNVDCSSVRTETKSSSEPGSSDPIKDAGVLGVTTVKVQPRKANRPIRQDFAERREVPIIQDKKDQSDDQDEKGETVLPNDMGAAPNSTDFKRKPRAKSTSIFCQPKKKIRLKLNMGSSVALKDLKNQSNTQALTNDRSEHNTETAKYNGECVCRGEQRVAKSTNTDEVARQMCHAQAAVAKIVKTSQLLSDMVALTEETEQSLKRALRVGDTDLFMQMQIDIVAKDACKDDDLWTYLESQMTKLDDDLID